MTVRSEKRDLRLDGSFLSAWLAIVIMNNKDVQGFSPRNLPGLALSDAHNIFIYGAVRSLH